MISNISNRIYILALIQSDGFIFKKVASTNGGEWSGPCPWCGGDDRFLIWPEYKGGRYWCRGCNKSGDAVQYIRDSRDLTFSEALDYLGIEKSFIMRAGPKKKDKAIFRPKETITPPQLWMQKAAQIVTMAEKELWQHGGKDALAILYAKGLKPETIKSARLGWNPQDLYRDRRAWGLPAEYHSNGHPKSIWIPAGIIIPMETSAGVVRIRIRRHDPGSGQRYVVVSGSSMAPLILESGNDILVVIESDLDGLLVWQEAAALAGIVAMGSAAMKPDISTHQYLCNARKILNALDYDEAGAKYAWKFWPETYRQKVIRWPVPIGKDPSDAFQQGLNIRAWIEAGIE